MSNIKKNKIGINIKTYIMAVVLIFLLIYCTELGIISGDSMNPTLKDKDYIIINKLSKTKNKINRDDIIVFRINKKDGNLNLDKPLIKRVIGLPGDHVVIYDGNVIINNDKLEQSYLKYTNTPGYINMVIPDNQVFVLGDNRHDSLDSRQLGTISYNDIVGKVSLRIYPTIELI